MSPLFLLELRYLRRTAKSAIWFLGFAVPFSCLALISRRPGEFLILLPVAVVFGQSAAAVLIARETESLALTVPLGRWARIRARLFFMIALAAPAALATALATHPWGTQKGPDLMVHFLNLFLTCLGSSLAYASFFPLVERLSRAGRILALLFISAVVLGVALAQGFVPGMPRLWVFVLTASAVLFVLYQSVQRHIEVRPAAAFERANGVPTEVFLNDEPSLQSRTAGSRHSLRPRGHAPLISLLIASCQTPLFLFQLMVFSVLALGAVFLPLFQLFSLFFVIFSLGFLFASLVAWASFLPTPYSRKKAFAATLIPVVFFLSLWTAARMICAFLWSTDWVLEHLRIEGQPAGVGGSPRALLLLCQLQDAVILFFLFTLFLTLRRPPRLLTVTGRIAWMALFVLVYGIFMLTAIASMAETGLMQFLRQPAVFTAVAVASLALLWRSFRVFRELTLETLPVPVVASSSRPGPVWSGGD